MHHHTNVVAASIPHSSGLPSFRTRSHSRALFPGLALPSGISREYLLPDASDMRRTRWQMNRIRWPASRVLKYIAGCKLTTASKRMTGKKKIETPKNTLRPASFFLEATGSASSSDRGLTPIRTNPQASLTSTPKVLGWVSPPHDPAWSVAFRLPNPALLVVSFATPSCFQLVCGVFRSSSSLLQTRKKQVRNKVTSTSRQSFAQTEYNLGR